MNFLFLVHRYPKEEDNSCLEKDLIKALAQEDDKIFVITTTERRLKEKTHLYKDRNIEVLYVKTGNRTKKYNLIEKIVTILSTPYLIKKAQKKYWSNITIDHVVGYTPFMANLNLINHLKRFYKSKTILFLWDIMPQTAKDMGVLKNDLIFRYMKKKELKLYETVDKIIYNCDESKRYLIKNGVTDKEKLILIRNPEFIKEKQNIEKKKYLRKKYGYSDEDIVFIFGGNMGMLQNLNNLLDLAKNVLSEKKIKFILIGDGKEHENLKKRVIDEKLENVKILSVVPKDEYDALIMSFDSGLIVLSEKNTVPNFPTKVTAYLKVGLPMFGILDSTSGKGLGEYIKNNHIGLWSEAGNLKATTDEFMKFVTHLKTNKYNSQDLFNIYKRDFNVIKEIKKLKELL